MNHGIKNSFLYASSRIINHSGNHRSSGTCFWVKNYNGELCIITNKHVLKHREDNNRYCDYFDVYIWEAPNNNPEEKPIGLCVCRIASFAPLVPRNPLDDIVCIKQPEFFFLTPPKTVPLTINYYFPYSVLATQNDFDNRLSVCDMLAFIGYPEPFYDTERKAPVLRSGVIASDPRFNFEEHTYGNCLAYEAFSLWGSSGSPVFATEKGFQVGQGLQATAGFYRELKLIGINSAFFPIKKELPTEQKPELTVKEEQHSGISLLYKSTSIIEAIDS